MTIQNLNSIEKSECERIKLVIWCCINILVVLYAIVLFYCGKKFRKQEILSNVKINNIFKIFVEKYYRRQNISL